MTYQIFDKIEKGEARWSWRLLNQENKEIAESELLFTKGEVISHIKKLRREIDSAKIVDIANPKNSSQGLVFEYSKDGNDWHWMLKKGGQEKEEQEIAKGTVPNDIFEGKNAKDTVEGWVKDIRKEMQESETKWKDEKDDPAYQEKNEDNTLTKGIAGSCDISKIKEYFSSTLDDYFNWEVAYVDNQDGPMLFIHDYSNSAENLKLASFALSLAQYSDGAFPSKCWITNNKVKQIDGEIPSCNPDYKEFSYKEKKFYPFSVNIAPYEMAVRIIVGQLYRHIDWS